MELRHLRYFVAVAEALNFSKAAEMLRIAQPAISRQIADLEREVGTMLLERDTRTVRLTAAGAAFLMEAKRLLIDVEAAVDKAQRTGRGELGELFIAFLGAPTMRFLPGLVKQYRDRFPKIRLQLQEMTPERQLEAFAAGKLHVGFTRTLPPAALRELDSEVVLLEKLKAVLPERHPAALNNRLSLTDLADLPFVLLDRGEAIGLYDQIIAACQVAGFSPKIVDAPKLMATVLTLVAAEQGVSLVPESVRNLGSEQIQFIDISPQPAAIELVMAWIHTVDAPPAEAFKALVRQNLEGIHKSFVQF